MSNLEDETTSPHVPPEAQAFEALRRRELRFLLGASAICCVLFVLLVASGALIKRVIELAPIVKNVSTSCLTVCCRDLPKDKSR